MAGPVITAYRSVFSRSGGMCPVNRPRWPLRCQVHRAPPFRVRAGVGERVEDGLDRRVDVPLVYEEVLGVDALIGRVGRYFEQGAIVEEFSPEPPLTFRVALDVPRSIRETLDKAASAAWRVAVLGR